MKKFYKVLGIAALIAVIGFGFLSCDDGGSGSGPKFSVSGMFKNQGSDVLFSLIDNGSRAVYRSIEEEIYEISGKLEDGDIIFNLNGTYDSVSGNYSASAASSFLRYAINGNSVDGTASATIAVKDEETGDWITFVVNVTLTDVNISGSAENFAGGIPSWAIGQWNFYWESDKTDQIADFDYNIYQWYFFQDYRDHFEGQWRFSSNEFVFIEADKINDNKYDIIFSYPLIIATEAQIKAAVAQFTTEYNLTFTFVDDPEDITNWDNHHWWLDKNSQNNVVFQGDWEKDYGKLSKWWTTNYLYRYLLKNYSGNQLSAQTMFTKIRFENLTHGVQLEYFNGDCYPAKHSSDYDYVKALNVLYVDEWGNYLTRR